LPAIFVYCRSRSRLGGIITSGFIEVDGNLRLISIMVFNTDHLLLDFVPLPIIAGAVLFIIIYELLEFISH